jgi:hypothetical protein
MTPAAPAVLKGALICSSKERAAVHEPYGMRPKNVDLSAAPWSRPRQAEEAGRSLLSGRCRKVDSEFLQIYNLVNVTTKADEQRTKRKTF